MPPVESGRVLVLEKDYALRTLFADYLEHCGYLVCAASDRQKLFETLSDFKPDVFILNLGMPVLSGFTMIEQVRSHSQWHQLPIIVVSGHTLSRYQYTAAQVGADAYLTKPVVPERLRETVADFMPTNLVPAAAQTA